MKNYIINNWQASVANAAEKNIGLTMLLLLTGLGFSAAAQHKPSESAITVSGNVICLKPTRGALSEVIVLNKQTNRGVLTGEGGHFSIKMTRGDTLVFTTPFHEDSYYVIPYNESLANHTIEIVMEPDPISQDAVIRLGPQNLNAFKREIIDLQLQDDAPDIALPVVGKYAGKHTAHLATGEGALTVSGPLSHLASRISRHDRLKKQINEVNHEE
ncbi:MAG TPA: hypothetical protein PKJ63_00335 [Cyclobacteriaceae bacterium]|nr:hypothetical protein [Cyclobacteriaceae bacterium]